MEASHHSKEGYYSRVTIQTKHHKLITTAHVQKKTLAKILPHLLLQSCMQPLGTTVVLKIFPFSRGKMPLYSLKVQKHCVVDRMGKKERQRKEGENE